MKNEYNKRLYIPLNLQFFKGDSGGEKTEKATPKKRKKAREEGQVAKSQEVSTAVMLIVGFAGLALLGQGILNGILNLFAFHHIDILPSAEMRFEQVDVARHLGWLFGQVLLIAAPMFFISFVVGIIMNLLQVGWAPTSKPMKPKFSKLNPLKGFKKIVSLQSLVNFVKSMLKMGAIGIVVFMILRSEMDIIPNLIGMEFVVVVSYIGGLVSRIGITIGVIYVFIALMDYAYTRWKHEKDLRMSKYEVKEEWKQAEGNPQIKSKIRQKMREVSMRRMMQDVPQADVIITNPTHYAIALKYDMMGAIGGAPKLVAKGVDFMAKRIREKGQEFDVPIIENPPLARTIYADVEIGEEIPEELYVAVAEIMAYVFRLRNPQAS